MEHTLPANWIAWVYLAATVAAIVWLAWHYALAVESTKWTLVRGKIVKAWVEEKWGDGPNYSPRVEYIYKVNGLIYTSFTLRLTGDLWCRRRRARRIADYYDGRDPVNVWYDPNDPERATLKTGGAGWLLAGLIAVSILGPLLAFAVSEAGQRVLAQLRNNLE
jgi:hypothetical protein